MKTLFEPKRERIVPGAFGIGKVKVLYKPRRKLRINKIALIPYFLFFGLMYLSYGFTVPYMREHHVLPFTRWAMKIVDSVRLMMFSAVGRENISATVADGSTAIISADSLSDLMYAQGRQHAIDRLYQMDVARRYAYGTLATIFGEKALASDKFCRALNFKLAAQRDWEQLDHSQQLLLTSFADGVNTILMDEHIAAQSLDFAVTTGRRGYITSAGRYPYEPWQPLDSLVLSRFLFYQWSHHWEDEFTEHATKAKLGDAKAKTFKLFLNEKDEVGEDFAFLAALGANIIAVGKDRSKSGAAFLVNDVHSSNNRFNFWYANHLQLTDGSLNVTGLSYPGVPFVWMGRNEFLSWALAPSLAVDTEDVYLADSRGPHPVHTTTRIEEFNVWGMDELLEVKVSDSIYGPNILPFAIESFASRSYDQAFLSSTALTDRWSFRFLYELNTASTHNDLNVALQHGMPGATALVFALASGEIGSVHLGRELNHRGSDGRAPIVVNDQFSQSSQEEQSDIPVPSSRIVEFSTAKTIIAADVISAPTLVRSLMPSCVTDKGVVHSDCSPSNLALEEVQHGFLDISSPSGLAWKNAIVHAIKENKLRSNLASHSESIAKLESPFILESLHSFVGQYSRNSVVPTLVEALRTSFLWESLSSVPLLRSLYLGRTGAPVQRPNRLRAFRALATPNYFQRSANQWLFEDLDGFGVTFTRAFKNAISWLSSHFDMSKKMLAGHVDPNWKWSRVHAVTWSHPLVKCSDFLDVVLSLGPFPVDGGLDTVFRSEYSSSAGLALKDALESIGSFVTSARMSIDWKVGSQLLSLPTGTSIRAAMGFHDAVETRRFLNQVDSVELLRKEKPAPSATTTSQQEL